MEGWKQKCFKQPWNHFPGTWKQVTNRRGNGGFSNIYHTRKQKKKQLKQFQGYAIISYDMIWYDMIWYDMIWYDMIWWLWWCCRWFVWNMHKTWSIQPLPTSTIAVLVGSSRWRGSHQAWSPPSSLRFGGWSQRNVYLTLPTLGFRWQQFSFMKAPPMKKHMDRSWKLEYIKEKQTHVGSN